jgi:hypothetical protein
MERGFSPLKLGRTDALTFFSQEEAARAPSYHRPLYWAGAADVVIETGVLAALVWSGAGRARSRLAAVVGSDACVRGDRRRRLGGGAEAACLVERVGFANSSAALGACPAG